MKPYSAFDIYEKHNTNKLIGAILWVIAFIFFLFLFLYKIGCVNAGGFTQLQSYGNPVLDILTEFAIVILVLIGSYLIFSTMQLMTDSYKLADKGNIDGIATINPSMEVINIASSEKGKVCR